MSSLASTSSGRYAERHYLFAELPMRMLYSTALYLLLPGLLARLLWRSRKSPEYRRRLCERFGYLPQLPGRVDDVIWVHAVSLGEAVAATALIEKLLAKYPGHTVLVTTSTPAGSQHIRQEFGHRVWHSYAPWDTPGATRRFVRQAKPGLLVLLETELWPNWIAHCRASHCKVMLASGRMSERSSAGYQRAGALGGAMFAQLDKVGCQSQADADRLRALGVREQALTVTGSLKYELEITPAMRSQAATLRSGLGAENRTVFLAASTHAVEEPLVLQAFQTLVATNPDSLLIMAPRQPERFDAVYAACLAAGWPTARYSKNELPEGQAAILLCDTIGDLPVLFGCADIAFIGGSLANHGGHNPVEAALWEVPVLSGPHVFNFAQICTDLEAAGGLHFVGDSDELAEWVVTLASTAERQRAMGLAARNVVEKNRGALNKTVQCIDELLQSRARYFDSNRI